MQAQSPWAAAFRGFDDMDDDRKRSTVMQFLHAAGQNIQSAQVVPKPKDDEIELRGVYAGYPVRAIVDPFWQMTIDMKAPNQQTRKLRVRFDPDSAPSPGDTNAWDESDEVRVFLARCVYVEDSASDIDGTLKLVESLPLDFRQHLYHRMQTNDLGSFGLSNDGPGAAFRQDFGHMWDPMVQLGQALWIVGYGANVYNALPVPQGYGQPGAGAGAAPPAARPKCRFCGTIFLLGPTSACPNCGAAYTG
jgi:hypothetical protein